MSGVKKERQMNACYTKKNDRIDLFEKLPDEALLSAREVSRISGRSRTSLWRDVARGSLADPVKIGAGFTNSRTRISVNPGQAFQ